MRSVCPANNVPARVCPRPSRLCCAYSAYERRTAAFCNSWRTDIDVRTGTYGPAGRHGGQIFSILWATQDKRAQGQKEEKKGSMHLLRNMMSSTYVYILYKALVISLSPSQEKLCSLLSPFTPPLSLHRSLLCCTIGGVSTGCYRSYLPGTFSPKQALGFFLHFDKLSCHYSVRQPKKYAPTFWQHV